ncbi:MAG: xanthine dehydrogenase family protein molybdopterin-binding subunit [Thaumarchaeota archaeon]|nr:xanthine dehydrogenase family protein molybdopterin-binding subunit [Candidatus Calditenuaceae archaeon]MDW8186685.1 xanthine dehydrogenase family protein molybdopterin-binding subunit [Nitrososphaerota archaeon]
MVTRYVGKPILPEESIAYVMGKGMYVDDVRSNAPLHLAVLRSPYPNAIIKKIDCSDAVLKSKLVLLPRDNQTLMKSAAMPANFDHKGRSNLVRLPALPSDLRVRFEGQPVAAVVAESRYEAHDLLDSISVEYEQLPPVKTIDEALRGDVLVHEETQSNISVEVIYSGGEIDTAFSEANLVIEDSLEIHKTMPNPIETRGILAELVGDKLKVWSTNQGLFRIRDQLTDTLGLPKESLIVEHVDVGGAFGVKSFLYPEQVLVCYAALILKRPVKWIETRSEHLRCTTHSRDVRANLSLAVKRDGKILGIRGTVIADIGAYNIFVNPNYAPFIAQQLTGPYDISAGEVRAISVFTNKTPLGPYRGAGRPEAAYFYERMVDLVAEELGLDPVEVRKRNLVPREKMPYRNPFGLTLDVEDYNAILNKAIKEFRYEELKRSVSEAKAKGELVGIGVVNYIELNRASFGESAKVILRSDGKLQLMFGSSPHGQYHQTVFRQLAADELRVGLNEVVWIKPSSDLLPQGVGTFGSRSAVIGGEAVIRATRKLKQIVLERASEMSGVNLESLDLEDGWVIKRDDGERLMRMSELIKSEEIEVFEFVKGEDIFSYGVHMAVVELDKETYTIKRIKYFAIDDAGRVINPLIAEAQVTGGIAQGLSQVLYESVAYNDEGLLSVGSILEAGVPAAADLPIDLTSELHEYPSHYSHGVRGIGEAGTIGALPCIVAALEDALNRRLSSTRGLAHVLWSLVSGPHE